MDSHGGASRPPDHLLSPTHPGAARLIRRNRDCYTTREMKNARRLFDPMPHLREALKVDPACGETIRGTREFAPTPSLLRSLVGETP